MRHRTVLIALTAVGMSLSASSGVRAAGSNAAEEAAIRRLIAADAARVTSDSVWWSGAFRRPDAGDGQFEFAEGPASIPNRVPGSETWRVQPIRIVVADSRDMAWEYNKSTLGMDLLNGKHVSITVGMLRIWEKQKGKWKVAAEFIMPYDFPESMAGLPSLNTK